MQPASSTSIVVFAVHGELYGFETTQTREVIQWMEPRSLPGAESWVQGVINLRGEIIPVCDLAWALGLDRAPGAAADAPLSEPADPETDRDGDREQDRDRTIIIAEADGVSVGYTADAVRSVVVVAREDFVEMPATAHPAMRNLIELEDQLIVLLDPTHVLDGSRVADHNAQRGRAGAPPGPRDQLRGGDDSSRRSDDADTRRHAA